MARIISTGVKPTPNFVKMPSVEATEAIDADSNKTYFVNTSAAQVTMTLPAAPTMGDIVRIFDVELTFDTNNLIIDRNGNPIMGTNENMAVNTEGAAFELVYYNSTKGWRLFTI